MREQKLGFTLIEIMIVVMIIGMLARMSYPSYKRFRENAQRTVCINNLRIIQHAADRYLFDHPDLTELDPGDLNDFYKQSSPTCPSGGTYSITLDGGDAHAFCDFGFGHEL